MYIDSWTVDTAASCGAVMAVREKGADTGQS